MTELEKLIARLENDDKFIDAIADAVTTLNYQASVIEVLENKIEALKEERGDLDMFTQIQLCGHAGRYTISTPHGTHVCALCVIDSMSGEGRND